MLAHLRAHSLLGGKLPKLTTKEGEQVPPPAGGGTEQRDASQPAHHPSWMQGVHRHQEPPVTLRTVPSKPKGSEGSDETDQQSHD